MKNLAHDSKPDICAETVSPNLKFGLSSAQVGERVAQGFINKAAKRNSKSYLSIFTENIFTFFNLLGLIVFIALIYANAEIFNFVFVLVFITNIAIGIIQEIRAKICIDRLSIVANKKIHVLRDGKIAEIFPEEIVLGDVVKLSAGVQIPADCTVADGETEVNESLLTGESLPIKKRVGDSLLSGSYIIAGNCTAIVEHVGNDNYVQQLSAKAKKYKKPHSEIMNSLYLLIKVIGFIIVPIAAANIYKALITSDLSETILGTSSLVIGMIPSGMILLTSLALAVGIIKLAARSTLVQDLYSLETLARVDVICFDKTGTITDGNMNVAKTVCLNEDLDEKTVNDIISSILGSVNDKNHTALALANFFGKNVIFPAEKTLPFNSARKFSAATLKDKGTFLLGAPEFALKHDVYERIRPAIEDYCSQGYRVICLACACDANGKELSEITADTPVALVLLLDNIRKEAVSTVKWFTDNGVAIKVISGDNPITVAEVSKRAGIPNSDKFISLEGLSDEEVEKTAESYTVFGRVSPEQKAILVRAIKKQGHVTAMTGDGVNDILALKEADCAISVASGSDAARSVAHLVLLDDNFNSMPDIVREGRRVINNVQGSSSLYLMKTMFVMLLSFLTLVVPNMNYPFSLKQMNLLELVVIGIPSFFLSLQPNHSIVKGSFINGVLKKSLPGALLMIFSVIAINFFAQYYSKFDRAVYNTYGVFAFTFAGLINLLVICRPLNKYRSTLFAATALILITVFIFSYFNGIPFIGYSKLKNEDGDLALLFFLIAVLAFDAFISFIVPLLSRNKPNKE